MWFIVEPLENGNDETRGKMGVKVVIIKIAQKTQFVLQMCYIF